MIRKETLGSDLLESSKRLLIGDVFRVIAARFDSSGFIPPNPSNAPQHIKNTIYHEAEKFIDELLQLMTEVDE
jgi:hypothetical protein